MKTEDITTKVNDLIKPVADEQGIELVSVSFRREQGRGLLQILIDREGGVSLDDCSMLSREAGTILDVEDIISGSYNLEVSSPGINRTLSGESDFNKYAGRTVLIRTRNPVLNKKKFHAKLIGIKDGKVILTDDNGNDCQIDIANIKKARLDVDLSEMETR